MKAREQVRYMLVNPPLTDPTTPYHSIPYLVGSTVAAGFTAYKCLDVNIDLLNFMAEPAQVERLLSQAAAKRSALEERGELSRGDQLSYRYLLKGAGLPAAAVPAAIEVMRDPSMFYNYALYRRAVSTRCCWPA